MTKAEKIGIAMMIVGIALFVIGFVFLKAWEVWALLPILGGTLLATNGYCCYMLWEFM